MHTHKRVPWGGLATLAALAPIVLLAGSSAPALAQKIDPAPQVTSTVGKVSKALWAYRPARGVAGRNLVSIDFVSTIHRSNQSHINNGFHKICELMGLKAPPSGNPGDLPSIDGDLIPDNALLRQYDGQMGTIATYQCNQVISSATWTPGQGVEILITVSVPDTFPSDFNVPVVFDFVQATQGYPVYSQDTLGKGKQLVVVPIGSFATTKQDICDDLNLFDVTDGVNGDTIITYNAENGIPDSINCNKSAPPSPIKLGPSESAFIFAPRLTIPLDGGLPINCLSRGIPPCPLTGAPPPPPFSYPGMRLFPFPAPPVFIP